MELPKALLLTTFFLRYCGMSIARVGSQRRNSRGTDIDDCCRKALYRIQARLAYSHVLADLPEHRFRHPVRRYHRISVVTRMAGDLSVVVPPRSLQPRLPGSLRGVSVKTASVQRALPGLSVPS